MSFDINTVGSKLNELKYINTEINMFCNYCLSILNAKDKNKNIKNPWMQYKTSEQLIDYFSCVKRDGLLLDGKHITLQSTGISYDYIAYKNKMLTVYPESIFDEGIVYKDDSFQFKKESGRVIYTHDINNPFGHNEKDIVGCYCIIKNKRGEFLTTLSIQELEKHRKVAKTDYIWSNWLVEMYKKTVIKKACKVHFEDIYQNIETIDNENYDLEKPLGISIETKQEIEKIKGLEELIKYYQANKNKNAGIAEDFNKALAQQKATIQLAQKEAKNENH